VLAFSPDGTTLASGGVDGSVRIWNARSGSLIHTLTGHTGEVRTLAFSTDGTTLASGAGSVSGSRDYTVRIWDAGDGSLIHTLTGHTIWVTSVAWSRDGATLASGGLDRTVRIWDARDGSLIHTLTGHTSAVQALAFSPDGTTLASGGDDHTVRIWNARSGSLIHTLTGHTDSVNSVAYSPDGTTLASGGADATIRVWNPRTGAQVAGTRFGVVLRPMRPLAGVRSDQPAVQDLLGVEEDVETLAALVAASATEPPLAIALLGEWGAGKSSVMAQLSRRVEQLAALSRNNLGLSSFAANIRQVSFNAWHYSDDRLWTGLIEHLFQELAADPSAMQAAASPTETAEERDRLRIRLDALSAEETRLTGELTAASAAHPTGVFAALGSPMASMRLLVTAVRELSREARARVGLLVAWGLVAALACLSWAFYRVQLAAFIAAVGGLVAPFLVAFERLRAWRRQGMRLTIRTRRYLEQQRQQTRAQAAELTAQLAELDAAVRLSAFLADRAQPANYQEYRGLLGHVHRDLRQLDTDLRAAREQWRANPTSTPPLERIVLYIDDLDRCPPERVVEVLAAVHLMLALPLFVVVVAVDPRWLVASLRHHYRELFTSEDTNGILQSDDGLASPLDYLDKIFQIPFAVAPLGESAASSYLTALLRPGHETPTASPPRTDDLHTVPSMPATDPNAPTPIDDGDLGNQSEDAPDKPTGPTAEDEPTYVDQPQAAAGPDPSQPASAPTLAALESERNGHEDRVAAKREAATENSERTMLDLRPEGLRLHTTETEFMARLGPLLPTPRAAKKLVNLYRLVRIGTRDQDLAEIIDGEMYQVVQILLAILVGAPTTSRAIFTGIMHATTGDLIELLHEDHPAGVAESDWAAAAATRRRVADALHKVRTDNSTCVNTTLTAYQQWCPKLARYSFHTRSLSITTPSSLTRSSDSRPGFGQPANRASSKQRPDGRSLAHDRETTPG
jgi:hypothetical protein